MNPADAEPNDETLAEKVQGLDRQALSLLVQRHARRFYQLAYRVLQNQGDAEDMVQLAFLKFWQDPKKWNPKKNTRFTTWFYRVVINLCLDHLKKHRRTVYSKDFLENTSEASLSEDQNLNTSQSAVETNEEKQVVAAALRALPERQRLAVTLCFYEELKQSEAAQIMGIKLKALESLLSRAKANLKKHCESYLKEVTP